MFLVLESVAAMEALYGPRDALRRGPAAFVRYEDAIAPFLSAQPGSFIRRYSWQPWHLGYSFNPGSSLVGSAGAGR